MGQKAPKFVGQNRHIFVAILFFHSPPYVFLVLLIAVSVGLVNPDFSRPDILVASWRRVLVTVFVQC